MGLSRRRQSTVRAHKKALLYTFIIFFLLLARFNFMNALGAAKWYDECVYSRSVGSGGRRTAPVVPCQRSRPWMPLDDPGKPAIIERVKESKSCVERKNEMKLSPLSAFSFILSFSIFFFYSIFFFSYSL